jgi:outer membrane biosynthesis protein TonB
MMRKSTFISAALHTAILLFALVAFPAAKMEHAPLVAIPVDLATPSELTKIKAGTADAKDEAPLAGKRKEEKPEAVKEAANKAEQAPEEKPKAEQKPEEKPKPETPKEAAPKPEAKKPEVKKADAKKPEEKPAKPKEAAAAPPKKPKPPASAKKRDFNTDRIAALLNKIPDAVNEPNPVLPSDETPSKKVRGQSDGTQMTMSVNEIDALRSRIAQCWSPPPGGLGAGQIVVKLRLKLNEDGTLVGYPTVANSGSSPFFQAAADSAVRAVYQCQPYSLPSDKYALWRDMILNFDPSEMYRAG